MWLGKPAVDELIVAATEVPSEMRTIQAEPVPLGIHGDRRRLL